MTASKVQLTSDSREKGLFLFVRGGEPSTYYTDWREIISRVPSFDPTIRVKLFTELNPEPRHLSAFADMPTLAVSLYDYIQPLPRGRVIRNQMVSKLDQLRAYKKAGLPFPTATVFKWGMKLDTKIFGEFVVLKPLDLIASSRGHIELRKTEQVSLIKPSDFPDSHPIRHYSYLVQKYIHTGDHPSVIRVTNFCQANILCYKVICDKNIDLRKDLTNQNVASNNGKRSRILLSDPAALELSRQAARCFLTVPTQAFDLIKEDLTNNIYILESNLGGNTWHFSNKFGYQMRKEMGEKTREKMLQQFDCYNTAAMALVSATKYLAI